MPVKRSRALASMMLAGIIGVAVAIAITAGPALASGPTYNLEGGWSLGSMNAGNSSVSADGDTYTITAMDMSTGAFSGTAEVEGTAFAVAGTESGSVATYTLSEGSYTAYDTLNLQVLGDGNVGGTGTFYDTAGHSNESYAAELTTPTYPVTTTTGTSSTTTTGTTTTGTTTTGTTTTGTTTTGTTTTGTMTTTTTTPLTTTTSTAALIPTATSIECDYYVATSNDTCSALVGNADGSISSNPTGTVTFSGDRTGACSLQPISGSPGVASCSITVPGTESEFLNVTASYGGDNGHSVSGSSTSFLTAGLGNGLYNSTIQQFNPQTLQFTEDNPVAGSTLTGLGQFTEDATSCSAPTADNGGTTNTAVSRVARAKQIKVQTLTVKDVVRHAKKGKVRLKLGLSPNTLRKLFPGTHTITLQLRVTIAPPHGVATTILEFETFTLKAPKHGKVTVSKLKLDIPAAGASTSTAHARFRVAAIEHGTNASDATVYKEVATISELCDGQVMLGGTLHLRVTVPGPSDPDRGGDTTASLNGSIQYRKCGDVTLGASVPATISGSGKGASSVQITTSKGPVSGAGGAVSDGDTTKLGYVVNTAGGQIGGTLGTGNAACPTIQLNAQVLTPES